MKLFYALAGALAVTMPALAGSFAVKFEVEGEHVATWTYDDDGTATSDTGETVQYQFDPETETFTATTETGDALSAKLIGFERTEGHQMVFESVDGATGTATIIDVSSD